MLNNHKPAVDPSNPTNFCTRGFHQRSNHINSQTSQYTTNLIPSIKAHQVHFVPFAEVSKIVQHVCFNFFKLTN